MALAYAQSTPSAPQVSAAPAQMQDIIDIKPPLLPEADLSWLYWGLGILALCALIALAIWLWRKKRKPKTPPPLPAYVVADNALQAIEQAKPAPRDYYFQLSRVFRTYLENGLGLRALEKTTEELAPCLDKLPVDKSLIREAKIFLKRADPVKYAGMNAEEQTMQKDLSYVRSLVDATKPRPEEKEKKQPNKQNEEALSNA